MTLPLFKKPPEKRSRNMRAIRSTGNKTTEKRLASLLKESGITGWKLHPANIAGRPDFVIARKHLAVFVDGCFFHGCPSCGHIPRTNRAYWMAKITRNRRRDAAISRRLRAAGYRVVRIKECQLRTKPERCINLVVRGLVPDKLGQRGGRD